jgi:carbon-monoxide dehydrogenase medium subunit
MLPAALVLDGVLEAVCAGGSRQIPLCDFFIGVKKHVLQKNELVTKITFPVKAGNSVYLKKKRIKGHDLTQAGVAAFWAESGELSIAVGAAAPTPVLISGLGPFDKRALAEARIDIQREVLSRIDPISDLRSTREYRVSMVKYFIDEVISRLTDRNSL